MNYYFKVFVAVIGTLLFASCSEKKTDGQIPPTSKDPVQLANARAGNSSKLRNAILEHHSFLHKKAVDLKGKSEKIDRNLISSKIKECKTEDETIALFKKAGMKDAEKYVKTKNAIVLALAEEISKNPEMKKWTKEQYRIYLEELRKQNKEALKERRKSDIKSIIK